MRVLNLIIYTCARKVLLNHGTKVNVEAAVNFKDGFASIGVLISNSDDEVLAASICKMIFFFFFGKCRVCGNCCCEKRNSICEGYWAISSYN